MTDIPVISAAPLTSLEVTDQLGYSRSVFETVREPLLLLDGQNHVHMANAAFFRTFKVTSDETVGQPLSSLSDGQWKLPELKQRLRHLQLTGEAFEDFEIARVFDRVGYRVLLLTGRLLDAPHNGDRMTLLAIDDLTDRRRVEKALAWHATELERSNRDLEGYAMVASHDLQEPLRKIRAFGDLLLTECGSQMDDAARGYATRMVAASARMQTLVGDLLRLAVVGTSAQKFSNTNLGDVVAEVLVDLDLTIREANANVVLGALPTIECDRLQMRQLFQNLITNALKFKGTLPPEITIDAAEANTPAFFGAHEAGPWVSITVSDNGIGFEPRHMDLIFGAFQRLHGRDKYAGSGIGLTLCRRICERHSGSIAPSSVPNVGTQFTVTLPTRQPLKD